MRGNGVHLHGICDHNAVISHLFPEKAVDDPAGQSGRQKDLLPVLFGDIGLCLDLRKLDVRRHDHIRSRVDPRLERHQVTSPDLLQTEFRAGEMRVAVLAHISVTREVLECRSDPRLLKSA